MNSISKRTIYEATGLSPQEESEVWAKMPESPFRKLIQYEIEVQKAIQAESLSTIVASDFTKQQGIVQGLTIALGILARKDPQPSKKQ